MEIWTPEDEQVVLKLVERHGAARVKEVAKGLGSLS